MDGLFCNQCGRVIPEGSKFCNYCGARLPAFDVQTLPAEFAGETTPPIPASAYSTTYAPAGAVDEQIVFVLRPTMIFVFFWYAVAVLVVLVTSALVGLMSSWWPESITRGVALPAILIIGLIAFSIPVYKHIMRRREVYTLTNHKLEIRYGLISITILNIPLRNIQEVTVTASAWQRLLKLGNIIVESASETGTTQLSQVHNPYVYSSMILAELRRRN